VIRRLPLTYWGLVLTYLAVAVNLSVTSVALPTIGTQLPATTAQLSWIFNVTPLLSAGVVLLAGGWADRFGRRRVLVIGLLVFTAAAALSSLATDPAQLIVFRALTGVGSAMAMPTALALAYDVVDEDLQATAVGVLGSTQAGGALLGPLIAGVVLAELSWRAVFLSVIPLLLLALVGALRIPARDAGPHSGVAGQVNTSPDRVPIDGWGAGLASLASIALVFTIIEAAGSGLSPSPALLVGLSVAVVAGAALVRWERRAERPLFDPHLMRRRDLRLALTVVLGSQLVLGGLLFVSTLQFQVVLGYSPLASGLLLLPALVAWVLAAAGAGRLARLVGIRAAVTASLGAGTVGLLLVAAQGRASVGPLTLLGLFLIGMLATAAALMTHVSVSVYPQSRRGAGSAINAAAARLGFSLGVALLGAVLEVVYVMQVAANLAGLSEEQAGLVRRGAAGVNQVAATLPAEQARALKEVARAAAASGVSWSLVAAAALTATMAALVATMGRGRLGDTGARKPDERAG